MYMVYAKLQLFFKPRAKHHRSAKLRKIYTVGEDTL